MLQVTGFTNQPNQQTTIVIPSNGTKILLQMSYVQQQLGWFFTQINWNNGQFIEKGRRLVNHGNFLRQYKNLVPFGMACFSVGNREPTQVQDLSSGATTLWVLTVAEVAEYEGYVQGKKNA